MIAFKNRPLAEQKFPFVIGAFAITQLTNDPVGYYIISEDKEGYKINFSDITIKAPINLIPVLDVLKSRTTSEETINNADVYITQDDLE